MNPTTKQTNEQKTPKKPFLNNVIDTENSNS